MALGKTAVTLTLACAVCVAGSHAQTVGDLIGSDAETGSVVLAGGTISAKDTAASLKLSRGGELRICPHSRVSLTASNQGRNLIVGMLGTGAIEANYQLARSADILLTGDFRILLHGPGAFHFAVAIDAHGNTCIHSLPGNSGSLVVTEAFGDGVYQVRSGDEVVFHNGRVSQTDSLVSPGCGCGPAHAPIHRAENSTVANEEAKPVTSPPFARPVIRTSPEPVVTPESSRAITRPGPRVGSVPGADIESESDSAPSLVLPRPADSASSQLATKTETIVQIDAPFVFRAEEPSVPPPPIVATISLPNMPDLLIPIEQPLPPPAAAVPAPVVKSNSPGHEAVEPVHDSFFGKLGAFFARLFGKRH